jgi:hypothetical protein
MFAPLPEVSRMEVSQVDCIMGAKFPYFTFLDIHGEAVE